MCATQETINCQQYEDLQWSPEAEKVKGCCAEVIFGPKLSVDQSKSQGIQKVDLKHFKFSYYCWTFYKLGSAHK